MLNYLYRRIIMLNYVYKVTWNECPDEDTFETFDQAKEFIQRKWNLTDPNYVSPFVNEIELVDDENGNPVPTGNDVCVFSWDSQNQKPNLRQPKLFDDSKYDGKLADNDFEIYDNFIVDDLEDEEEAPLPADPYGGRNLFDFSFDEALTALNEADENYGECQCCHEEFAKSDLIKGDDQRYICKKCAYDLGIEESLEETVPEDLADDRTPIQGDVHVLGEPVDYKKEITKEKLIDESFTESYNTDEFKRYMDAANKLGLETGADVVKFSEEHGNVKDKELLKVMEEEAAKLG